MRLYTKHYSTFSFVGFMKLLLYFTAKYLEIRYLYLREFNRLKLSFMTQKIHSFIFGIYPNRFFHIYSAFLCENPWKVFDPCITFILQISTMYVSKSFSVFLWNFFQNITGMPLRGHLLAARIFISTNKNLSYF